MYFIYMPFWEQYLLAKLRYIDLFFLFFSLNRIRTQLDDVDTSLKSPFRLNGGKRSHSPLGLYRKPSPSQLPR